MNSATVAARSDMGPREVNEDRSFTSLSAEDGSWVIAVADGLDGHPRGAEAAEAAVAALPSRIASEADMETAFMTAHRAVAALAPSPTTWQHSLKLCPMTALCVAAWTPEGGLIVAHMGHTLPVLVRWQDQEGAEGHVLGVEHVDSGGWLTSCLGIDVPRTDPARVGAAFSCWTGRHVDCEFAVVVMSDGVWEKRASDPEVSAFVRSGDAAGWVVEVIGPVGGPAERIAEVVLAGARGRGLDDNATVAVALMAPSAGRHGGGDLRVRLEQRESTTLVGSGGIPPATESTPRMVQ